jgi:alpha-N-acetylglucosaminidase
VVCVPYQSLRAWLPSTLKAQFAGPTGQNFTGAIGAAAGKMDAKLIASTGAAYVDVLNDADALTGTDTALMLGPWLAMAKEFAADGATDCVADTHAEYPTITTCKAFYEWNARVQLTTWNPTPKDSGAVPGGPIDYASKHWSGLIADYYGKRVELIMALALTNAAAGTVLDKKAMSKIEADHAYNWTTATNEYPVEPVGDFVAVSKAMHAKYAPHFASC